MPKENSWDDHRGDAKSGTDFTRIAVFRALQLGDMICVTPALRALRARWPEARITLIGLEWAREFAALYSRYIDDFIVFPGLPGWAETKAKIEAFPAFLSDVQARKFDLAIQMQGSGTQSNPLVALFGARHVAGTFVPNQFCPEAEFFLPHRPVTHEIWRWLELMEHLGARAQGTDPDFFVPLESERKLLSLLAQCEAGRKGCLPGRPYVCLHPGAREAFRCWSEENFARVGDELFSRGFGVVVTGSNSERAIAARVVGFMKNPALDLSGRTDLGVLGALIQKSALVVCNDTGVSHLAVALKKPSVVVFTRSEFLGWPPLNRTRHRVVSRPGGPEVEDVLAEILDLVAKEGVSNASFEDPDLAHSRKLSLLSESCPV
jgi:ADP-heptose:LPS heptosyltransferase